MTRQTLEFLLNTLCNLQVPVGDPNFEAVATATAQALRELRAALAELDAAPAADPPPRLAAVPAAGEEHSHDDPGPEAV